MNIHDVHLIKKDRHVTYGFHMWSEEREVNCLPSSSGSLILLLFTTLTGGFIKFKNIGPLYLRFVLIFASRFVLSFSFTKDCYLLNVYPKTHQSRFIFKEIH